MRRLTYVPFVRSPLLHPPFTVRFCDSASHKRSAPPRTPAGANRPKTFPVKEFNPFKKLVYELLSFEGIDILHPWQ